MTVDFHCHTIESDGTVSAATLVAMMRARGVGIYSITDHDTLRAYDGLDTGDATVIPGIEINTTFRGEDVHVLGYGVPLGPDSAIARTLASNREQRRMRLAEMVAALVAIGVAIDFDEILAEAGSSHALGRPHVARALVRGGYATDVPAAFAAYLVPGKPGYRPSHYITPVEAVEVICASGAIPVLAHPGRLKDGSILDVLVEAGLAGLEVFYPTHTPAQTAHFRARAAHFGLVMTGGSDFHDLAIHVNGVGVEIDQGDLRAFLELLGHA